jgi:hypothetical protein
MIVVNFNDALGILISAFGGAASAVAIPTRTNITAEAPINTIRFGPGFSRRLARAVPAQLPAKFAYALRVAF